MSLSYFVRFFFFFFLLLLGSNTRRLSSLCNTIGLTTTWVENRIADHVDIQNERNRWEYVKPKKEGESISFFDNNAENNLDRKHRQCDDSNDVKANIGVFSCRHDADIRTKQRVDRQKINRNLKCSAV